MFHSRQYDCHHYDRNKGGWYLAGMAGQVGREELEKSEDLKERGKVTGVV